LWNKQYCSQYSSSATGMRHGYSNTDAIVFRIQTKPLIYMKSLKVVFFSRIQFIQHNVCFSFYGKKKIDAEYVYDAFKFLKRVVNALLWTFLNNITIGQSNFKKYYTKHVHSVVQQNIITYVYRIIKPINCF